MFFNLNVIKTKSLVHENVNDDQLAKIVERAEDTDLLAVVDKSVYDTLKTKYDTNTLNSVETTFVEYMLKFLAVSVDLKAIYYLLYELRNITVGVSVDGQIRATTREELTAMQDMLIKDYNSYKNQMVKFGTENQILQGSCNGSNNSIIPISFL